MLSDSGPTVITVWYPKGDIVNFLEVAPLAERKPMVSSMNNDSRTCNISMVDFPYSSVKSPKAYLFSIPKRPQSFIQILSR